MRAWFARDGVRESHAPVEHHTCPTSRLLASAHFAGTAQWKSLRIIAGTYEGVVLVWRVADGTLVDTLNISNVRADALQIVLQLSFVAYAARPCI